MTHKKNFFAYLFLNVIISAITMLVVLWAWNGIQQNSRITGGKISESCIKENAPAANLPSLDQKVLEIKVVYSPGNLMNEIVVVKRVGGGELDLTGWQIVDENGHKYQFPALTFNTGDVNIHSASGVDSAQDLFWGRQQSVWQTGEVVKVFDPNGNERASYIIP
jgi:hypothetical protein